MGHAWDCSPPDAWLSARGFAGWHQVSGAAGVVHTPGSSDAPHIGAAEVLTRPRQWKVKAGCVGWGGGDGHGDFKSLSVLAPEAAVLGRGSGIAVAADGRSCRVTQLAAGVAVTGDRCRP